MENNSSSKKIFTIVSDNPLQKGKFCPRILSLSDGCYSELITSVSFEMMNKKDEIANDFYEDTDGGFLLEALGDQKFYKSSYLPYIWEIEQEKKAWNSPFEDKIIYFPESYNHTNTKQAIVNPDIFYKQCRYYEQTKCGNVVKLTDKDIELDIPIELDLGNKDIEIVQLTPEFDTKNVNIMAANIKSLKKLDVCKLNVLDSEWNTNDEFFVRGLYLKKVKINSPLNCKVGPSIQGLKYYDDSVFFEFDEIPKSDINITLENITHTRQDISLTGYIPEKFNLNLENCNPDLLFKFNYRNSGVELAKLKGSIDKLLQTFYDKYYKFDNIDIIIDWFNVDDYYLDTLKANRSVSIRTTEYKKDSTHTIHIKKIIFKGETDADNAVIYTGSTLTIDDPLSDDFNETFNYVIDELESEKSMVKIDLSTFRGGVEIKKFVNSSGKPLKITMKKSKEGIFIAPGSKSYKSSKTFIVD